MNPIPVFHRQHAQSVMELGRLVATTLSGSWRQNLSPVSLSADILPELSRQLLRTGTAGLGWRLLRESDAQTLPGANRLKQAYRLHTLQASLREEEIRQAFTSLRSVGVEPLLGKGWAIARLYPERGLRPYGDIDLCVRPGQYSDALAVLKETSEPAVPVDLQIGFRDLKDRTIDQLYQRSVLVRLGEMEVRVLGTEDHLRFLCLHMLGHGVSRPLWLCDIGLTIESPLVDFDWDYFLSGDRKRSDWVSCAIRIAHEILGARLNEIPINARAKRIPRWVVPAVLNQWGAREDYMQSEPMHTYLKKSAGVTKALRLRWPNPIQATVEVGGPFNEWPRLPFQLADCVRRSVKFLARQSRVLETWCRGVGKESRKKKRLPGVPVPWR